MLTAGFPTVEWTRGNRRGRGGGWTCCAEEQNLHNCGLFRRSNSESCLDSAPKQCCHFNAATWALQLDSAALRSAERTTVQNWRYLFQEEKRLLCLVFVCFSAQFPPNTTCFFSGGHSRLYYSLPALMPPAPRPLSCRQALSLSLSLRVRACVCSRVPVHAYAHSRICPWWFQRATALTASGWSRHTNGDRDRPCRYAAPPAAGAAAAGCTAHNLRRCVRSSKLMGRFRHGDKTTGGLILLCKKEEISDKKRCCLIALLDAFSVAHLTWLWRTSAVEQSASLRPLVRWAVT